MPSIAKDESKHVVIDRRPGQYLCFPDVCCLPSGRLICAYNDFDQHVAKKLRLVVRTSDDLGVTWTPPRILGLKLSHCPRLTVLPGGEVHLLDANGTMTYVSLDQGETWAGQDTGLKHEHVVADRPLLLPDGTLLTTAHGHRGEFAISSTRQAPTEQMVFHSFDYGAIYAPRSVLHFDKRLLLCEASMCLLPDGSIAALLRENSGVYEPMYLTISRDEARTWSEPEPTILVGHRPTMNLTGSGKVLVTYRNVGPGGGTRAWMGTLEELVAPYPVHGTAPADVSFTAEAMHVPTSDLPARWTLRPMTDAPTAAASIECEVRADSDEGCGVFMGHWWHIFRDHIRVNLPGAEDKPVSIRRKIPAGQFNTLRFGYAAGVVTLHVNGRKRLAIDVDENAHATRIMAFGSTGPTSSAQSWKRVSHRLMEPRYLRQHTWDWDHAQGLPNAPIDAATLELGATHGASYADFGYSGWCELPDGRLFCVYHHANGQDDDYEPGRVAYVRGSWFTKEDFK